MARKALRIVALATLLSLPAVGAWAGEPPHEQPAVATEPKELRPFTTREIPREFKRAKLELARITVQIEPSPDVAAIAEKLPSTIEILDGLYAEFDLTNLDQATLRQLDDDRQTWLAQQSELLRWETTLETRAKMLETVHVNLQEGYEVWTLTRETAIENEFPQTLIERLVALFEDVDSIEARIDEQWNVVLDLQGQIATAGVRLATGIQRIESAQERTRRNLFNTDRGPIWRPTLADERQHVSDLGMQVGAAWRRVTSGVERLRQIYGRQLFIPPVLFVMLLALLISLRPLSRTWDQEDRGLCAVRHAVRRSFATALLAALLTIRFLYPLAPGVIFDLSLLIALFPVQRLVPGVVWPQLRAPLYGLIGLLFIQQIQEIALDGSLLERLLLLLVNTAALVGLVWIVRPGGPAADREAGRAYSAIVAMGRLATIGLVIALGANLIGAVKLANLLTDGVLYSSLAAVVLLAVTLILDGMLTLLFRSSRLRSIPSVRNHGDLIHQRTLGLVHVGAVVWWIWATLVGFRLQVDSMEALSSVLSRRWTFGSFEFSVGNVLAFIFTIWVATLISRGLRLVLAEDVLPRVDLPRGMPATISMLVHYAVVTIGFVLALAASGIEVGQFAILAGALGVGIGFGLQNLVNNFVSGLILIFERPIKVGDTVEIGPLLGVVRRIGIRASIVRAFTGAEVIVPNANLIANEVINWTLSDRRRRIEIPVGVAYGTDPTRVIELLTEVARKQPDALEQPEPWVVVRPFGENSLDFELRFWTARFDGWLRVQSKAIVDIHDALIEAGIEIPFPQRDLRVRSVDEQVKLPKCPT